MKHLFVFASLIFFSTIPSYGNDSAEDLLASIPIQNGGRIKPFDTFSRELLRLVYGKERYQGKSASEIILTWYLIPEHWNKVDFVQIKRKDLKESLRLSSEKDLFSPKEILTQEDRLSIVFQELNNKRQAQEKLNPYYQSVERLEGQLGSFEAIVTGRGFTIFPQSGETKWKSVAEVGEEQRETFRNVASGFIKFVDKGDSEVLSKALKDFYTVIDPQMEDPKGTQRVLNTEVHYNRFHPFQWSWILYLTGLVLLSLSLLGWKTSTLYRLAWIPLVAGFVLQIYGFGLRVYITGRPPVSNMYETVIWVAWGSALFGMILEIIYRNRYYLIATSIVNIICLITADLAPTILDPSLHPLEPVLRSQLWLIVHVLTITLSYAAFFLAFVLGDIGLYYYLRNESKYKKQIQAVGQSIYRSIQVGVVLLAAGTILGGVWADYSWGRFWGWDPKETWALIALLGYIAILHGRLAGWLKSYGFIVSSILTFSLVIMAWYGVNFVLGAGLHSYGFGGGGIGYVASFIAVHIIYVIFVSTVRQSRSKLSDQTT